MPFTEQNHTIFTLSSGLSRSCQFRTLEAGSKASDLGGNQSSARAWLAACASSAVVKASLRSTLPGPGLPKLATGTIGIKASLIQTHELQDSGSQVGPRLHHPGLLPPGEVLWREASGSGMCGFPRRDQLRALYCTSWGRARSAALLRGADFMDLLSTCIVFKRAVAIKLNPEPPTCCLRLMYTWRCVGGCQAAIDLSRSRNFRGFLANLSH